jgi:hypothetical protein
MLPGAHSSRALRIFALEKCYVSPEHKEYVTAFMEKRKPDFKKGGTLVQSNVLTE